MYKTLSYNIALDEADYNFIETELAKNEESETGIPNGTIWEINFSFSEDISIDAKLVNSESGPYIEYVMFDGGREVTFSEPIYSLEGDETFEYRDNVYIVSFSKDIRNITY